MLPLLPISERKPLEMQNKKRRAARLAFVDDNGRAVLTFPEPPADEG